jgi:hypothetical protein
MEAFKTVVTVAKDGAVTVKGTPFAEGDPVEVVVLKLETPPHPEATPPHPHRGAVPDYKDPFEPAVSPDAWEALK